MQSAKLTSLSIVLPAYNEESNILEMIKECLVVAPKVSEKFEVIVVNDGSTDNTEKNVSEIALKHSEVILVTQLNQGYGGAIKKGFSVSKMDWIFFTDSDRQFDVGELESFIEYTDKYDFVFGYRKKRSDGLHRKLIATLLKIWNKIFLNFPLYIKDIDCAFKLLKRESFMSIGEIFSSGAMVSTEFILKIDRRGFKIKQLPVHHMPRQFGKSTGSSIRVIKRAVNDTFVIRKLMKNFH